MLLSKSFHNAPPVNSTNVLTVEDTVGNKADIAVTIPGNTTSVVAYLKGLFALTPIPVSKVITLNLNNTNGSVAIFTVTGSVELHRLYGVVTTVTTMANLTSGGFELYDSTAATGLDDNSLVLSGLAVGTTFLCKDGSAATAPALLDNATRDIEVGTFSRFAVIKKSGATTQIRFEYATTDAPINATLTIYAEYRALSSDGALTAV